MNLSTPLLALVALLPTSSSSLAPSPLSSARPLALVQTPDPITKAYGETFETQDEDGLRELWKQNPGRILGTIDQDLEGSLSLWEANREKPDRDAIAELHERALWGARIASEVSARPIFLDYAAAFVGWSDEQKLSFRAGQRAHDRARKALAQKDARGALDAARECRGLALALGDWWGSAMGYAAEGDAQAALGQQAEGLVASSQARLLYQQLGLFGSEARCLASMIAQLETLDRPLRLRVTLEQALALGEVLGDEAGCRRLSEKLEALPD